MVTTDLVQVQKTTPGRTSTFQVVAGAPLKLDLTTVLHANQTRLYTKAIYKLENGLLTYCVGAPGQPRPRAFATSALDGNTLVVLQRSTDNAR